MKKSRGKYCLWAMLFATVCISRFGYFAAVEVGGGTSVVTMHYRPRGMTGGIIISAGSVLLCLRSFLLRKKDWFCAGKIKNVRDKKHRRRKISFHQNYKAAANF